MAKKLLKKKAWDLFALYIKMRDANSEGVCECVTCGKELFFYEADCQAGHFVSGRSNAVLFDEKIVHTQCYSCNCGRSGEQAKYLLFMKRKFGYTDEQIEEILNKKHAVVKFSDADMLELIKNFYCLVNMLLSIKFRNRAEFKNKVYDKIASWGMKKMLSIDTTLGKL